MLYEKLNAVELDNTIKWATKNDMDKTWGGLPPEAETIDLCLYYVQALSQPVTVETLDAALKYALTVPKIFAAYEKQAHPYLLKNGHVSHVNQTKLFACAVHEFGRVTPETLKMAEKLLASRKEIQYEVQPKSEAELTKENEARDAQARVADKTKNKIGGLEANEVVSAAERDAEKRVRALHQRATPAEQAELSEIIADHREANPPISWIATITEVSAWSFVKHALAHPPGGNNHAERDAIRMEINAIIAEEKAAKAANPEDHALWLRIRRTVEQEVLSKYDRGIKL